jgi:hypothetical protein
MRGCHGLNRVDRNLSSVLDHRERMKKLLFTILLLLSGAASATDYIRFSIPSYSSNIRSHDKADICAYVGPKYDSTVKSTEVVVISGVEQCRMKRSDGSILGDYEIRQHTLTCTDPKVPQNYTNPDSCGDPPPPTCTAGHTFEATISQGTKIEGTNKSTDMKYPSNVGGCAVVVVELLNCMSTATGAVYCKYKLKQTGATSSGTDTETTTPPSDATKPTPTPAFNPALGQGCPSGTVQIGTDSAGGSICAGSGTAPAKPSPPPQTTQPDVTTQNPDGSSTTTKTTTRQNDDGSTTTTTRTITTNPDGSVTERETEVTGQTPTGATGKADPTKEESSDFCKKNPHLTICQNSTISGTCAATSCTGDAITCEIARRVREANCKRQEEIDETKSKAAYKLGESLLAGTDPNGSALPSPSNATNINLGTSLDQTAFLGGTGSCLADVPFTANGMSFTIPFSNVCPYLLPLRYAMLIIAGFISLRLFGRSILS